MREQKANDNGFPVVGKQVKEQQIFPFGKLVEYDGATNKITINANVTINGDTNIGELDIDSGDAPKGQVLTADGDSGASWENRVAYLNLESESGNLTNAQIEVAEQDNVIITLDGQFYYKNSQSDEAIVFKAPAKVVDDDTIAEKVVIDLSDNTYSYSYDVVATGGSFEPVYDDELNDSSTNAPQTKVVYAALNEKADTEDIENGEIVAGKSQVAESLETQVGKLDQTPFSYMSSGGQTDIESGIQRSIKLVGVNLVKNQIIQANASTNTINGITFTNNNDGTWTLNGTATATASFSLGSGEIGVGNKILYGFVNINSAIEGLSLNEAWGSGSTNTMKVGSNNQGKYDFRIIVADGTILSNVLVKPIATNLTQRYGSNEVVDAIIGNDTTKQVERLLQFDSNILKDVSFDAGSMLTVKTATLKSTGYNVWDEQWEVGAISEATGEPIATSNAIRSKNFIRVLPNKNYCVACPRVGNNYLSVGDYYAYDVNYNYLGIRSINNTTAIFITDANTCYIKIRPSTAYGTTYNHDICIFEYWDGSRIGYEPYEEKTETMPNTELNGILKVDASGNVYADGDELYPDNTKNKKRYVKVDLSELEWTAGQYGNANGWYSDDITNIKEVAYGSKPNALSNKYTIVNTISSDLIIGTLTLQYNSNRLWVGRESGDTTNKPTGTLSYELAEEQPLVADSYNPNLWADDFGHLQMLDENGNEINGLQGCEIFYKANISGFAESLYVRAEGEPENVVVQNDINDSALAERGYLKLASLSGYDDTKTQTLKNIEGVFTWVDDE